MIENHLHDDIHSSRVFSRKESHTFPIQPGLNLVKPNLQPSSSPAEFNHHHNNTLMMTYYTDYLCLLFFPFQLLLLLCLAFLELCGNNNHHKRTQMKNRSGPNLGGKFLCLCVFCVFSQQQQKTGQRDTHIYTHHDSTLQLMIACNERELTEPQLICRDLTSLTLAFFQQVFSFGILQIIGVARFINRISCKFGRASLQSRTTLKWKYLTSHISTTLTLTIVSLPISGLNFLPTNYSD